MWGVLHQDDHREQKREHSCLNYNHLFGIVNWFAISDFKVIIPFIYVIGQKVFCSGSYGIYLLVNADLKREFSWDGNVT